MAIAERPYSLLPVLKEGMPDARGWMERRAFAAGLVVFALVLPLLPIIDSTRASWISYGVIFVIVGLSLNVLMGYLGQVSLGHHAFVGVGAFTSAYIVGSRHQPFLIGVLLAVATGAVAAIALGFVALRLRGLYLALLTLAYGLIAESVIFHLEFLGGAAGLQVTRPSGFDCTVTTGNFNSKLFSCEKSYVYLVYVFFLLVLFIDWRLVKSKAGRAIFAIRENEVAAASFGVNVIAYKLLAFVVSGAMAGLAGALLAHWQRGVTASQFDFALALTFVLMVAVGGLGSRAGIFLSSMFFAIFPLAAQSLTVYVQIIGAILLLSTLALFPGGLGQQLRPITEWLRGKPFSFKQHEGGGVQSGGGGVRP
jgi:branched-chain amino acid transport system permease protein